VRDNLLLPLLDQTRKGALLSTKVGKRISSELISRFAVKVANPNRPVRLLSGGNQQKVVLAKWLAMQPKVIIFDEPTRGIDIGAKAEVHRLMGELAKNGLAIIMISSELPEILGMSDRIAVMHGGNVVGELTRAQATQEKVLEMALGHTVSGEVAA